MPRPKKIKLVHGMPFPDNRVMFKPAGIPTNRLELILLNVDEFEAMRLVDLEGKAQGDAASLMKVSQPTISRILNQGRKKVADAIANGKALRIEGGRFKFAYTGFGCKQCREQWPAEGPGTPASCPACESDDIYSVRKEA